MKNLYSEINKSKYLMGYDMKKTISENLVYTDNSIVITDWLSPDEKFVIFLDELYDISNKVHLGNVWENFDNFKFFLKHSFEVAKNIPNDLRESVLQSLNSIVLTESTKNYNPLKPYVKSLLMEEDGWFAQMKNKFKSAPSFAEFGNFLKKGAVGSWEYIKSQPGSVAKSFKTFIEKSGSGLSQLASSIADGDFMKAFELIGKGMLFLARYIRGALYHPVTAILEAILIATGIGKTFQFAIWAVVVALDIYEIITGDYENPDEPLWMRILMISTDIMGLVFTGAIAISARKAIKASMAGVKTAEQAAKVISKSTTTKKVLTNTAEGLDKVPGLLEKARAFFASKFPKMAKFFDNIMKNISEFIKKISDMLSTLGGGGKATTTAEKVNVFKREAGTNVGGELAVDRGMDVYSKYISKPQQQLSQTYGLSQDQLNQINAAFG